MSKGPIYRWNRASRPIWRNDYTILPKLSRYRCVFIAEHIPNREKSYTPNIDKAQGPDIRLYWKSGVFLDKKPFSISPNQLTEKLILAA